LYLCLIFPDAFANSKQNCKNKPNRFGMSICPHVTARELLNLFSRNRILGSFSEMCWELITVLFKNG
jgi:hypothetical protein